MKLHQAEFTVATSGRGLYEVTRQISGAVAESNFQTGLCQVFIRHTSASLLITENADPDVLTDLETSFSGLVTDGDKRFVHTAEGPDDMSAHVRSALTQTGLSVPVKGGKIALGTWQGIFVWEHRYRAHQRQIVTTVFGMN